MSSTPSRTQRSDSFPVVIYVHLELPFELRFIAIYRSVAKVLALPCASVRPLLDKPARSQVWPQPASKQKRTQKRLGTSLPRDCLFTGIYYQTEVKTEIAIHHYYYLGWGWGILLDRLTCIETVRCIHILAEYVYQCTVAPGHAEI